MFGDTEDPTTETPTTAPAQPEAPAEPAALGNPPATASEVEQAIAFVITKGYSTEAAKSIVAEHGWRRILADAVAESTEHQAADAAPASTASNEATITCECGANYSTSDERCPNCNKPKPR
jgi:hypothetical protein